MSVQTTNVSDDLDAGRQVRTTLRLCCCSGPIFFAKHQWRISARVEAGRKNKRAVCLFAAATAASMGSAVREKRKLSNRHPYTRLDTNASIILVVVVIALLRLNYPTPAIDSQPIQKRGRASWTRTALAFPLNNGGFFCVSKSLFFFFVPHHSLRFISTLST